MSRSASTPARLRLTPQDQGRVLSLEEFTSADGAEGYRYELIDGRLDVSPRPDLSHEFLCKWLERLLYRYVDAHPEVINAAFPSARVFLPGRSEATCPEPDLAVYRDFPLTLPLGPPIQWQDFSPVLVVEVISADTPDKDLERNRHLYWQVPSIEEYWIIDPRPISAQPVLLVLRRGPRRWRRMLTVPFQGTYTTPLLPGFTLRVEPHL